MVGQSVQLVRTTNIESYAARELAPKNIPCLAGDDTPFSADKDGPRRMKTSDPSEPPSSLQCSAVAWGVRIHLRLDSANSTL